MTPVDKPSGVDEVVQYLSFTLDDEVFAIEISSVREIIQHGAMTLVPLMPEFVRGVINLRGAVVPVIDLKSRFGRSRAVAGKKTCIIIFDVNLAGERLELGLMVDAVNEVVGILKRQIEPPPQFGGAIKREFIQGMSKVGDRFLIIFEPQRVLDIDEMAQLAAQTQTV